MVMMMRLLIIHDKRGRQSTAMKRVHYPTAAQTKKLTVTFKPAGITPIDSIVVDALCCLSCDCVYPFIANAEMNGRDMLAVVTKYASDDRHYNVFNYILRKRNGVWLVFQECGTRFEFANLCGQTFLSSAFMVTFSLNQLLCTFFSSSVRGVRHPENHRKGKMTASNSHV